MPVLDLCLVFIESLYHFLSKLSISFDVSATHRAHLTSDGVLYVGLDYTLPEW